MCDGQGSTRRRFVKTGTALAVGGTLTGCAGDADDASGASGSYSVTLAPAGEVTFEEVPEDVFTILGHHVDMALALGRGDTLNAMHAPGYHESLYQKLVHHFEGVSVDWEGLYSSWPPTPEKLYELDSDVHLADPAKVTTGEGWDRDSVEEIESSVAPWIGNTFSSAHETPPDQWAEEYEYYTLWEIFERIAAVFQAEDRYEALASVRDELLASIEESLPPESDRPSVAMVLFSTQDESLWGYKTDQPGYYAAHTRPMGATDALVEAFGSEFGGGSNELDYEALAEADPDALLVLGPLAGHHGIDEIRATLRNHAVASDLTAVENGNVYTQGARRQGPILNLFQLEMTAKQLYPDEFGTWPGYEDGEPYPDIPEEEQLFDRQRVADIINGDI